ncbi:MAG: hypothetical protein APF81_10815 [Desulfosporosinus sp. BRH_c37]|nr:MAG: hypothetical protein APF81_10815 [Desulfosporosinus sp. BRH_c37]
MLDIKKLVKVCSVRRFGAQDIIFKEGDPGSEMFIILSGSVRVLITAPNENKVEIALLKAGDTFGEMALLEGLQRSATVQALEETTTVAVNISNFESVICQEPALALRIMKSLSERIRRQNAELAKYKDQLCLNSEPLEDTGPLTIVEIKEENKLENTHENTPECDDFSKLIQYIGKYKETAPTNHSEYLFGKKILCPVCGQTIEVKMIRSSKLRLKQIEPDYRHVYSDFDMLWYIVWVCPHCYYANFNSDFPNISDRERIRIKELSSIAKDIFGPSLNGPPSLIQVFKDYYLTLYWLQQLPSPDFEKLGKLWLRLSWLYNDVQEAELSIAATSKALEYFLNLINSSVKTTAAQDQYLYLLLGELNFKMGKIAEARNYFRQSIVIKGGNERMKEQAQNRIQDLKSLV